MAYSFGQLVDTLLVLIMIILHASQRSIRLKPVQKFTEMHEKDTNGSNILERNMLGLTMLDRKGTEIFAVKYTEYVAQGDSVILHQHTKIV